MEQLIRLGTTSSPTVNFSPDGRLTLEGRSLPEDAETYYNPLIKWILGLQSEKVVLEMKLEYFNSASSKKIFDLLKALESNKRIKIVEINWFFEEGDEDCKESGELFEENLKRSTFKFHEFAEAS